MGKNFHKPPTKSHCVCVLMKPARVTHHDIRYAVKEGSYSQAENHLLYSENERNT